jgi:hypothetical protein
MGGLWAKRKRRTQGDRVRVAVSGSKQGDLVGVG